jgi:MHS family proline/betaine transporter-like MFS transporter
MFRILVGGTTLTYATGVFAVSYLETIIGVPQKIVFGKVAGRVGRKPMMISSAVGLLVFVYPYFYLISTGQFPLIVMA